MILPSIAKHASKYGIIPLKKYSQNFILDQSLCDKIVRTSGIKEGNLVLEIGPGTAGLTRAILNKNPKLLTVIEQDSRCLALLEELKNHYPQLHIIHGDACKFNLSDLNSQKINIISNLPYHIGTALVIKWLHQLSLVNNMTLMLQKEVVERICAKVNTKLYGRLSVICQLLCSVEKHFDISPQAFYPPPKVYSSIVKLTPLANDLTPTLINQVELITKLAFGERRKMIKTSLKKLVINIIDHLEKLNIDPNQRAENLSPQHYLLLAKSIGISATKVYN